MTPLGVALVGLAGAIIAALLTLIGVLITARTNLRGELISKWLDGAALASSAEIKARSESEQRTIERLNRVEGLLDTKLSELWRCEEAKLQMERTHGQQIAAMQRQIDNLFHQIAEQADAHRAELQHELELRERLEEDLQALRERMEACPHRTAR